MWNMYVIRVPESIILLFCIALNPTCKSISTPNTIQLVSSKAGISLLDCYKECNNRSNCESITYSRRALFCRTYNQQQAVGTKLLEGTAIQDLMVRNVGDTPQLVTTKYCDTSTCDITECHLPPSYTGMTIKGNMRNINAEISYLCENFFTVAFSTCDANGLWTVINATCVTYSYEYAGPNTSGSTENPLFVLQNSYLDACLKKCNETSGCLGVSFNKKNKTCISTNVGKLKWTFLINSHYYFNIRYPMSLHRNKGRVYNFTYTEGVEFCETIGTTLASYSDLLLAFQLGFGACVCGWIDGGRSLVVLQNVCGGIRVGITPCTWRDNYDVFCRNINFVNV